MGSRAVTCVPRVAGGPVLSSAAPSPGSHSSVSTPGTQEKPSQRRQWSWGETLRIEWICCVVYLHSHPPNHHRSAATPPPPRHLHCTVQSSVVQYSSTVFSLPPSVASGQSVPTVAGPRPQLRPPSPTSLGRPMAPINIQRMQKCRGCASNDPCPGRRAARLPAACRLILCQTASVPPPRRRRRFIAARKSALTFIHLRQMRIDDGRVVIRRKVEMTISGGGNAERGL